MLAEGGVRALVRVSVWKHSKSGIGSSFRPTKILIVETTRIGDVLLTTAAIRALRRLYPAAELTYVADAFSGQVLRVNPYVDRVVALRHSSSLGGLVRAIWQVRSEAYDLVLNCSPSTRNALLAWFARSSVKIGYFERFRSYEAVRNPIPVTGIGMRVSPGFCYAGQHLVDRSLDVVRALERATRADLESPRSCLDPQDELPALDLRIPEEVRARAFRQYFPEREDRSLVVVHATASWTYRTWSPERFRELLVRLSHIKPELRLIVVGSEGERSLLAKLAADSNCGVIVVAGKDLFEVAALIELADVCVGADSGPMHIASAVGTPCVALFGPNTSRATRPVGKRHRVLYKQLECSPCLQTVCVRPDNPCTHLISVEEVTAAVLAILAEEKEPRAGRTGAKS